MNNKALDNEGKSEYVSLQETQSIKLQAKVSTKNNTNIKSLVCDFIDLGLYEENRVEHLNINPRKSIKLKAKVYKINNVP